MPNTTDPNPPNRNAPAGLFGIFLFAAMVGAVCTVAVLVLTEEWTLIGAVGLGGLLAVVIAIVLRLMLRNPLPPIQESRDAFQPLSSFQKGEVPDEGQGVGGPADRRPTTTQDTLAVGGATGGLTDVAVPATAAARSPGEPAERPVPGAGAPAPGVAAGAAEAARRADGDRSGAPAEGAPAAEEAPAGSGGMGSGDPGGVDPAMPDPAEAERRSAAEAAEAFDDGAPAEGERHGGGGDPRGVDAEMPDPDAPAAESAEEAARAFDAEEGGADPGVEQVEPPRMDGPREGGPDDLQQIRGVGPKLEEMLHGMGIYHYDQIAAWGPGEVAWADDNLQGFKGRVSRDDWVGQARELSSGERMAFGAPHVTEG